MILLCTKLTNRILSNRKMLRQIRYTTRFDTIFQLNEVIELDLKKLHNEYCDLSN